MAKRDLSRFSPVSDDIMIEKHTKNSITGNERITRRRYTRDCVPIIDALSRSILVVGLVVSAIILAANMNPESLRKQDEANKMYVQKIGECNMRLGKCCAVLSGITNSIAHSNINLDKHVLVLNAAIDCSCERCKCPCCILEGGCK